MKRQLFIEDVDRTWTEAGKMEQPTFREWLAMATGLDVSDSLLRLVRYYRKLGEPFGRMDFGRQSH